MAVKSLMHLQRRRTCLWAADPEGQRGYLAGEQDPEGAETDGVVSVNGVPSSRWVEVWHQRSPREVARTLVAMVFSAPDGTWQVPDLPADEYYRVIAVDHLVEWESQIVEGRQPYVPES